MGVRNVTAPPTTRGGRAPFTEKEGKEIIEMLKKGQTPGPDEAYETQKECRKVLGRWVRYLKEKAPDLNVGTRAWENEDGHYEGLVRVKE